MNVLYLAFVLMVAGVESQAKPYFRLNLDPFNEIKSGAFFKVGTPEGGNVSIGAVTPVLMHRKEDGYLLIPGVDWNLLNAGWIMPTDRAGGTLILGPSINLDEPIKAFLRGALAFAPGGRQDGSYGALRGVLAPYKQGEKGLYLAVGPMWALDTGNWRGSLQVGATLSKRF